MTTTRQHTVENLQKLNERLAVIDGAQKNITDLASQVTSLQSVLANKQARGAFGQGRMEVDRPGRAAEGLLRIPAHALERQPARLRDVPARRAAAGHRRQVPARGGQRAARRQDRRRAQAAPRRGCAQDVARHVTDIAEKYLIPGETQDLALMFVPSESVYAELHDGFDDMVQKAYRAKVVIVSPSLLMLAIQVMQQIQKDARMREAADKIHAEVGHLMDDLGRLHERVLESAEALRPGQRGRAADPHLGREGRKARARASGRSSSTARTRRRRGGRHPCADAAPAAGEGMRTG